MVVNHGQFIGTYFHPSVTAIIIVLVDHFQITYTSTVVAMRYITALCLTTND